MSDTTVSLNPLGNPAGGKYDDLCASITSTFKAEGALLVVIGGTSGSGFSQTGTARAITATVGLLRYVADEIEKKQQEATLQ
jgi:hypothetical protein